MVLPCSVSYLVSALASIAFGITVLSGHFESHVMTMFVPGAQSIQDIQHLIYAPGHEVVRTSYIPKGIQVQLLEDSPYSSLTREETKWTLAMKALQQMPSNALVVLSMDNDVTVNPRILIGTDEDTFDEALNKFRTDLYRATEDGKIVISTRVVERPVSTGSPVITDVASETPEWISYSDLIQKNKANNGYPQATSILADMSVIAGKACDLLDLIETVDRASSSRDSMTSFMEYFTFLFPSKVVLDYQQQLFGSGFRGSLEKQCPRDIKYVHTQQDLKTSALFVKNPPTLACSLPVRSGAVSRKSFPVWNDDAGIALDPILDMVQNSDEFDLLEKEQTIYTVDKDGVRSLNSAGDIVEEFTEQQKLFALAHSELLASATGTGSQRWSTVLNAIDNGYGFPFIVSEQTNCAEQEGLAVFTPHATAACQLAFPFPGANVFAHAKESSQEWYTTFKETEQQHPWLSKTRQVLVATSLEATQVGNDIVTFDTDEKVRVVSQDTILDKNIALQYLAVVDTDYNSQLEQLLCSNSVTIKVEPQVLDYYYPDLVAWKHYIPVNSDDNMETSLSDAIDFVLDSNNDNVLQNIVQAANQWCASRFTQVELAHDMLDIWNEYVIQLDQSSEPNDRWTTKWVQRKQQ